MSSLPIAQYCGQAPRLSAIGSGRSAALSSVFHAMCAGAPDSKERFAMLQPEEMEELMSWKRPTDVSIDGHVLKYADAQQELEVAIDDRGNPCAPDAHRCLSVGHLDFAWTHRAVAYVADIKRSEFTVQEGPNSLQLHAYGLAYAIANDCDAYACGIWAAVEGRWEWGELIALDSKEAAQNMARVLAAARNTSSEYSMGAHCSSCYGRLRCPAYLLPPSVGAELRPLTGESGEITGEAVRELLLMAKRAKDAASVVEDWAKAYVKQGGTIEDPASHKLYRPTKCAGRMGLDKDALEKKLGDLAPYQKQGAPFERWEWRKA